MKLWYEYEMCAQSQDELENLKKQYKKIYDKWVAVQKINKTKLKLIQDKLEYLILTIDVRHNYNYRGRETKCGT